MPACTQVGVYFQSPEGQVLNSGDRVFYGAPVSRTTNFPAEYEMHLVKAIEPIWLEKVRQAIE